MLNAKFDATAAKASFDTFSAKLSTDMSERFRKESHRIHQKAIAKQVVVTTAIAAVAAGAIVIIVKS